MGSKIFRFKRQPNLAFIPGFATSGGNGKQGDNGAKGPSLYFCDYELTDSYYIDSLLDRIDSNLTISSTSHSSLNNTTYINGDIILTKKNAMYMLSDATSTSHKFDIEYIGTLRNREDNNASFVTDINLSMTNYIGGELTYKFTNATQGNSKSSAVNSKPTSSTLTDFITFLTARVNVSDKSAFGTVESGALKSLDYRFCVHLFLKNKKSISGKSASNFLSTTSSELLNITNFYKRLDIYIDTPVSGEIERTVSLSNRFMDKNHLFNNDIRYNIFNTTDSNGTTYQFGRTSDAYDDEEVVMDTNGSIPLLFKLNNESIEDLVESLDDLVNMSTYDDSSTINPRCGDSAYFSSMSSTDFENNVESFVKNTHDNFCILSIQNVSTGKIVYTIPDITTSNI